MRHGGRIPLSCGGDPGHYHCAEHKTGQATGVLETQEGDLPPALELPCLGKGHRRYPDLDVELGSADLGQQLQGG